MWRLQGGGKPRALGRYSCIEACGLTRSWQSAQQRLKGSAPGMPSIPRWDACAAQASSCCLKLHQSMDNNAMAVETHRGDEGQDEAAAAAHFAVIGAVLHVLPQQPSILLVHAHCLLNQHRLTCTGASSDSDQPLHMRCRVQMAVQVSAMKGSTVRQHREAP